MYSVVLGGDFMDTPSAVAVDAQGSVYLVGHTYSRNFPVTQGSPEVSLGHGSGFIVKLGPMQS